MEFCQYILGKLQMYITVNILLVVVWAEPCDVTFPRISPIHKTGANSGQTDHIFPNVGIVILKPFAHIE